MTTTRSRIDSGWQVSTVNPEDMDPSLQLPAIPAEVPGHVHLDLHRAGVIPDPFYRLHERDVVWVDDTDWTYQTTFSLESVPEGDVFLSFLGLDTIAEISLNGQPVGQTDNMFVPHEFEVSSMLQAGENTLTVAFRSARRVGRERQVAWSAEHASMPRHYNLWDARSFVRKAQYMFGWDWGPILISCGIWQPVELITAPVARILDWRYEVSFEDDQATLQIEATVARSSRAADTRLTLIARVEGTDEAQAPVPDGPGELQVSLPLQIEDVRRWSPDHPELYDLELTLQSDEEEVDARPARIGLRTVELIREAEGSDATFRFRINEEDVFCKGANWIPADSFPSRSYDNPDRLRPLLTAAKESGFNMLRIWGGGMYESETFYDLCDELGIMVWQDFPYACAYYPDDPQSQEAAEAEARAAVRRVRVHPSLALWCGNNENHQMHFDKWAGLNPPHYLGQAIYETVLPRVVAEDDPATPYWPSSPYAGENPNSPDIGDRHNWDVWHAHGASDGDWPYYAQDRALFCSEFGFASSCGLLAWDSCLAPADRAPASAAVQWHDKTRKPYDVYLGYIERHFPTPETLDDLVYYSQLNQAEAMKFGVEHYRRLKGRCWGTLIWQINDCWPVQSWAMIDYLGEPKAVYYAAKRFYAPILPSLCRDGETVEAHVVNDLVEPISGRLTLQICSFDGTTVQEKQEQVSVGANAAARVASLTLEEHSFDPRAVFVSASFTAEGTQARSENVLFLAEPKELQLPEPQVQVTVSDGDQGAAVTLEAGQFAAYAWLSAPGLGPLTWSDNFFHLLPGRRYTVSVQRDVSPEVLRERLTVRTLRSW